MKKITVKNTIFRMWQRYRKDQVTKPTFIFCTKIVNENNAQSGEIFEIL
jgi:hypothetical protein